MSLVEPVYESNSQPQMWEGERWILRREMGEGGVEGGDGGGERWRESKGRGGEGRKVAGRWRAEVRVKGKKG